ncbi:TPA: hypothetical protein ACWYKN_005193, partial [Klebsiella pneumoniae]
IPFVILSMKNEASLPPSPGNEQVMILVTFCSAAKAAADKKNKAPPLKTSYIFSLKYRFA